MDDLAKWAFYLGLGRRTGIPLAREVPGLIPTEEWKMKRLNQPWNPGETLSVAIGQGYVSSTPLQLAVMLSTVVNGGTRYRPQYVKRVESPDGTPIWAMQPEVLAESHLKKSTVAQLKSAMRDVVMSGRGTGARQQDIYNPATGAVQGFFAGRIVLTFQRLIEIWGAIPELYLLIIFASIFDPSLLLLLLALLFFDINNMFIFIIM